MSSPPQRYRPYPMMRVGANVAYFPDKRRFEDFSYDPIIVDTLLRWDRFVELERAIVTAVGGMEYRTASEGMQQSAASTGLSLGSRLVRRLLDFADRLQIAHLERDPMFLHMKARLERLVEEGFLISDTALVSGGCLPTTVRTPEREVPSVGVDVVGVLIRARADALHHSLAAALDVLRSVDSSSPTRTVVVDASGVSPGPCDVQQLVRPLERRYGRQVRYCDHASRLEWIDTLIGEGVPPGVAGDALDENRGLTDGTNSLLLEASDQRIVIGDDTSAWSPRRGRAEGSGPLTVTQESFFTGMFGAPDQTAQSGLDLCATFARTLGRTLPTITNEWRATSPVEPERLCSHLFRAYTAQRGRVVICSGGSLGSATLDRLAAWWPAIGAPYREKMLRTLPTRSGNPLTEMMVLPTGHVISHNTDIPLPTPFAIDNARLGIPIFTLGADMTGAGTGELFRVLLHHCVPDAYCAHVPYAFPAAPACVYPEPLMSAPRYLSFASIVSACLSLASLDTDGLDTNQRLRRAGDMLIDCGSVETGAVLDALEDPILERSARDIQMWQSLANALSRRNKDWASRLRRWCDVRIEAMRRREYLIARELAGSGEPALALDATRQHLIRTGLVLRWWPIMVAIARGVVERRGE